MAEFTLPKNSRITKGRDWQPEAGKRLRTFKVFRYDPESGFKLQVGAWAWFGALRAPAACQLAALLHSRGWDTRGQTSGV
jgi:hypothetical protein